MEACESAPVMVCYLGLVYLMRPHRLTVRTPGSHPGNPGSIPGEVTNLIIKLGKANFVYYWSSIARCKTK